jgi:hypothetical protein
MAFLGRLFADTDALEQARREIAEQRPDREDEQVEPRAPRAWEDWGFCLEDVGWRRESVT